MASVWDQVDNLRLYARPDKWETEKLGTVTNSSVGASACTVLFDGEDPDNDPDDSVLVLTGYIPNVGDRVWCRRVQARWVAIGRVGVTPTVRVGRSVSLNLAAAALTAMPWNIESWDSGSMWDQTLSTRLFPPVSGLYQVHGAFQFDIADAGTRAVMLRKNSGGSSSGGTKLGELSVSAAGLSPISLTAEAFLAVGDYVEWFYYQNTGGVATSGLVGESGGVRTWSTMRLVA